MTDPLDYATRATERRNSTLRLDDTLGYAVVVQIGTCCVLLAWIFAHRFIFEHVMQSPPYPGHPRHQELGNWFDGSTICLWGLLQLASLVLIVRRLNWRKLDDIAAFISLCTMTGVIQFFGAFIPWLMISEKYWP